jgi:glutathione S-transferase
MESQFRLYGFSTQNTMKALYVLEELELDYELEFVNLFKGEQKKSDFIKKTPIAKVPLLQHGDRRLFESGAICRYLADINESELYPSEKYQRALVDQWMDFFSCHLGRYLSGLVYETIIVQKAQIRKPVENYIEEAIQFVKKYLPIVDQQLQAHSYLTGDQITIADLFAFAYIEQTEDLDIPLDEFPNIQRWFHEIKNKKSIQRGKQRIQQ